MNWSDQDSDNDEDNQGIDGVALAVLAVCVVALYAFVLTCGWYPAP